MTQGGSTVGRGFKNVILGWHRSTAWNFIDTDYNQITDIDSHKHVDFEVGFVTKNFEKKIFFKLGVKLVFHRSDSEVKSQIKNYWIIQKWGAQPLVFGPVCGSEPQ